MLFADSQVAIAPKVHILLNQVRQCGTKDVSDRECVFVCLREIVTL